MCSIATAAQLNAVPPSPLPTSSFLTSTTSNGPDILWRDDNFTAYHEKANPVSSKGHVVILFKCVLPSPRPVDALTVLAACTFPPYIRWYGPRSAPVWPQRSYPAQSTTDLPLLIAMQRIGQRLLNQLAPPATPSSPDPSGAPTPGIAPLAPDYSLFKIGFISYPFKDSKIPVTDHLHAHCYVDQPDLAGWWRKMAYGPLAWYSIEDLIAEIRCAHMPTARLFSSTDVRLVASETSTNNRVKVKIGSEVRPIDTVPTAGARAGFADGRESTVASIGVLDPEEAVGLTSPTTPTAPRRASSLAEPIPRPSSVTPLTAPDAEATPPPSVAAE